MSSDGHGEGDRRHSTGGDLRGGKSKAGAKPPAAYQGRRARLAAKRAEGAAPEKGKFQDGPKGALPKSKVSDSALYQGMGRVMAEALGLVKEQTTTTAKGQPGIRPRQQPNSTRTKKDIENKMAMARNVGPKKDQLPDHVESRYTGVAVVIAETFGLFPVEENESPSAHAQRTGASGSGGSSDRGTRAKSTFEKRKARIDRGVTARRYGTSKSPNAPKGSAKGFKAGAQGERATAKLGAHKPTRTQSDADRKTIIANKNKGIDSEKP